MIKQGGESMAMHRVVIDVPTKLLTPLIELVEGEGGVVIKLSTDEAPQPTKKTCRYMNGIRNKGISGEALILKTLTNGPVEQKVIETAFKDLNFASSTATSRLTKLRQEKKVQRRTDGLWELTMFEGVKATKEALAKTQKRK
jgi:hypothetical protein